MAMAEEAMVPAAAEVAALRLAAEVAEPATVGVAEAKRRRGSEAEGKRRRAQPDECLCARLGGASALRRTLVARLPHNSCGDKQRTFLKGHYRHNAAPSVATSENGHSARRAYYSFRLYPATSSRYSR